MKRRLAVGVIGPAAREHRFVKGTDNQLWHKWYDGTWNGPGFALP